MFKDHENDFYGIGTIGEKGQIVVPSGARTKLNIATGDKFIFFGHGKIIHLVKADEFNQLLDKMTEKFAKIRDIKEKINRQGQG